MFAGKLVKFLRHTIFPKHIDCFVLALVSDFSFQRKQIEISRYQNIRIKAKVSGENVQTIYTLSYAMLDRKFLALSLVVVYGFKITFFSTALLFWKKYCFLLTRYRLVASVEPGCWTALLVARPLSLLPAFLLKSLSSLVTL